MRIRIAPSLLSADFAHLAEEIADVEKAGADMVHLDLMDGCFVPNLTFGPLIVQALARHTSIELDAHLMVEHADDLLAPLARAGVARIAVHVEACRHLHRTLTAIRDLGVNPGVALNPATPVSAIEEALQWVDFVLVMSVNPGFGGQAFIAASLGKIRRIRRLAGPDKLDVAVDGGVGPDNASALIEAGATTLVAGSSVYGQSDRRAALQTLRSAGKKGLKR